MWLLAPTAASTTQAENPPCDSVIVIIEMFLKIPMRRLLKNSQNACRETTNERNEKNMLRRPEVQSLCASGLHVNDLVRRL